MFLPDSHNLLHLVSNLGDATLVVTPGPVVTPSHGFDSPLGIELVAALQPVLVAAYLGQVHGGTSPPSYLGICDNCLGWGITTRTRMKALCPVCRMGKRQLVPLPWSETKGKRPVRIGTWALA